MAASQALPIELPPPWPGLATGRVVHAIHFAVSARSFVWPLCEAAAAAGHRVALGCDVGSDPGGFLADAPCEVWDQNPDLSFNPWRLMARWWGWVCALRAHQPVAMLHAHQSRAALVPLAAAWWVGVPHRVYHNHGLPYLGHRGPLRWALKALEGLNAAFATEVILVSHSNAEAAQADGLFARRTTTVWGAGSAVGLELPWPEQEHAPEGGMASARAALGIPQDAMVWLYVGRPHRRKGFHFLMDLWASQPWGQQGQILLLAGIRPDALSPWGQVAGVRALGYVKELGPVYQASQAVVLPSHHEGFSYAMLEGAAHGKALLASDVPGLRCTVQPGVTGQLLPLGDTDAWVATMGTWAHQPDRPRALGLAARQRVRQAFLRQHVVAEHLHWLNQRVAPPRDAP